MKKFIIQKNKYLNQNIFGYYNQEYLGYHQKNNPDYLNRLKNMSNTFDEIDLVEDFIKVCEIATQDILKIIKENKLSNIGICVIPRSKAEKNYKHSQLMFKKAISSVAKRIHLNDFSNAIVRIKDSKTTHNWRLTNNEGKSPYVGITSDTCIIDSTKIKNYNIILVDDIYTKGINICEDCIQTLLNLGAKNVILYVLAKTKE